MIKSCKICGISDLNTLNFLVNHSHPPRMIGFICNFKKSPRYVEINKLREFFKIDRKRCEFVAVLVKPNNKILSQIKDLNFDYYQLYDCNPSEIRSIKKEYNKKIISAFTIQSAADVEKYKKYEDMTDIYLFDSKGYEKSMSFDYSLLKNIKFNKEVMIAGNIKFNDNLENLNKIADIIDISGGLETSGFKDNSKIDIFLNNIKNLNNET